MKITQLIAELKEIKKKHGDIEVTCTASNVEEDIGTLPDVYESTVENLIIREGGKLHEKRVRLYL